MSIPGQDKLKQIWAEVPPDYYFKLNYWQNLWHEWKWLVLKHLAVSENFVPKTILEVGCAGGHLSGLFSHIFPKARIIGIDVHALAVMEAHKRFPKIMFKVADAHKLPFKNDSFDLVICSETIEHVVSPSRILAEIERVMKKNGRAIIEMDSGSLLFRLIWFLWTQFGKGRVWKRAHLHPFLAKELEKLIINNGFIIKKKIFSHFGMAVSFLVMQNMNK